MILTNLDSVIRKQIVLSVILCVFSIVILSASSDSQQLHKKESDSVRTVSEDYSYLDSLKPVISKIIFAGNDVTNDDIIIREMSLSEGMVYSTSKAEEDKNRIYNLGIFSDVELVPVLMADQKVNLKVEVQEKWYIYPMPQLLFQDGDVRKMTVGGNIRWQNFRGRNENFSVGFGIGYNPFVRGSYTIPWIGKDLHLFTSFSGSISKERNRSLVALGKESGQQIIGYRDTNFDYQSYSVKLTTGKFLTKELSVFADVGYTFLRVLEYADNRTLSPNGVDKYVLLGIGLNYDSRNSREYSSKGYMLHTGFEHYGLLSPYVDFGRFSFEQRAFVPFNLIKDYSVTFASRFYTSVAIGANIPYYNHKFLSYGGDYVRGWGNFGFEGDNDLLLQTEFRFPLISQGVVKGDNVPVIKSLPYLHKLPYRYGLFFTIFYDVGSVWNEDDRVSKIQFMNGVGVGLNAIMPFGMIGKIEWAARLGKPTVGQVILGLGAKF